MRSCDNLKDTCCIVLAAGEGKRMKSNKPKVLTEVVFKPMLGWIMDTILECGIEKTCVVTGFKNEMVNEYLNSDQPYLQIAALTAVGRSRIDRKLNSPFTDSYILNIDRNKFTDTNVQKVYDRVSICLRE